MNSDRAAHEAPNAFTCGAYGCPCFGTVLRGSVWVCSFHAFARDPESWPLITTWLRRHRWIFNLLGRVGVIDPLDFDDDGPRRLWRSVANFCDKHDRPDLAPQVVEVIDCGRDRVTGEQTRSVRQHDERRHQWLWHNRVMGVLLRECLDACEKKPSTSTAPSTPATTHFSEVNHDNQDSNAG